MNIIEATKKASKEDKGISSHKANSETITFVPHESVINTFLIIDSENHVAISSYGWPASWNPKTTDLLLEDWKVVDYDKKTVENATKKRQ